MPRWRRTHATYCGASSTAGSRAGPNSSTCRSCPDTYGSCSSRGQARSSANVDRQTSSQQPGVVNASAVGQKCESRRRERIFNRSAG